MSTADIKKATLLGLPSEIRLLIWEYAFGNIDINLYYESNARGLCLWQDSPDCEECAKNSDEMVHHFSPPVPHGSIVEQIPWLTSKYQKQIDLLSMCKTVYSEAMDLFLSTLTIHVKSSETLAFIRSFAPPRFREKITRIVLYIHLQNQNEMAWYTRLVEINRILPGLRHIAINYHMHAPASYNELGDGIYMSMPLFALNPPFNKPLYVVTEPNRSETCARRIGEKIIPSTDPRPGVSIHTAYRKREILFSSAFLGDVTTDDVIDEHTSVIRALFEDEAYVSAANLFLESDDYHRPWRTYGPYTIPRTEVPGELIMVRGGRALLDALVQVSRRFERPWFEKLQKRRIVELYMQHGEMNREEAEELVTRQIAGMGDEGVAGLLEMLVDDDGELQVTF